MSLAKDTLNVRQTQRCFKRVRNCIHLDSFFFPATLRHGTNIIQAFFSKPQFAAGLPLAVHCQVQETGLFYQVEANLG